MVSLSRFSHRSPLLKALVVLFILAIAAFSVIPNYFTNRWTWEKVLELSNVQQLRALQQSGLALSGWQTLEQQKAEIGGHKWSVQAIVPATETTAAPSTTAILLMLRPQTWHRDLPQMDWMDINGAQQWTVDTQQQLQFSVPAVTPAGNSPVQVNARFLRGWSQRRTYAVLQWYAWAGGGDPAPSQWFWADQLSQLRDRRHTAWVAVSILIPIKPLGEIASVQPQAVALGQLVQSTLMAEVFR